MTLPRRLSMLGVPRIRARINETIVKPRTEITTARRYAQTSSQRSDGAPWNNFSYVAGPPNGQFNGAVSDNTYAYSAIFAAADFGFTAQDIPDAAVIIGVSVFITRMGTGSAPRLVTERLNTIATASATGDNRSTGRTIAGTETAPYGSKRDAFGLIMNASELRASLVVLTSANFGFYEGLSDCKLWLDAIGVEVTYLL